MISFIYIALGGAMGAICRYLVYLFSNLYLHISFPWGTLIVNLIGSFVVGLLFGIFEIFIVSENIRLFLFVGILGSFTTFSTFSLESFKLLKEANYIFFAINTSLNLVLGIGLVFLGYFISKYFS